MHSGVCLHLRAKPAPLWPASRWLSSAPFKRRQTIRVHRASHSRHWSPDGDDDGSSNSDSSTRSHGAASNVWGAQFSNASVSAAVLPISQQSLNLAFHLLDRNEDGLINRYEAYRMVAFYLALQQYQPPEPAAKPLTWDQHLLASMAAAGKLSGGAATVSWAALEAFVAAKLSGGLQKTPPRCSDVVWAGLGMATAFLLLGVLATAAKTLPVVGLWHQQGLPLLLGSFGTIAILLFGKPEADAVRLWPLMAGQLGATAIAVSMIQLFGAGLITRACAMAATVMYMMWTDTIHPPGGALVLMSMDNVAIQQFQWAYMLWPSLLLCLAVMLPISAATNWLRRTRQFDWPGTSSPAATLQQKEKDYREQQQKKVDMMRRHTAMMLSDHLLVQLPQAHEPPEGSHQSKGTVFRLEGLSKAVAHFKAKQQLEKLWHKEQPQQPEQQKNEPPEDSTDRTGKYVADAGRFSSAAAAALDATVKKRLKRESDRKLEDQLYHKQLWGPAIRNFEEFEQKLQKLHEKRLKQIQQQQEQQQQQQQQEQQEQQQPNEATNSTNHSPPPPPPPQQQQEAPAKTGSSSLVGSNPSLQSVHQTGAGGSRAPSRASYIGSCGTVEELDWQQQMLQQQMDLYSQPQQSQSDKPAWMYRWRSDIATVPGIGDFGAVGPLDSFAPDDEPHQKL